MNKLLKDEYSSRNINNFNKISEFYPENNLLVLVHQNIWGNEYDSSFVATYRGFDKEWIVNLCMDHSKHPPNMKIYIPIGKLDLWTYVLRPYKEEEND